MYPKQRQRKASGRQGLDYTTYAHVSRRPRSTVYPRHADHEPLASPPGFSADRVHQDDGEAQEYQSDSDAQSLREFYRAVGGNKGWRRQHGWSTASIDAKKVHFKDYDGVTVSHEGRVDHIRLNDNHLSVHIFQHAREFPLCTFPRWKQWNSWDMLSSLRHLTVLDLSNNSLRGGPV